MDLTGFQTQGNGSLRPIWNTDFVTGGNLTRLRKEVLCAEFDNTTVRDYTTFVNMVPDNADLEAGCILPPQYRYFRVTQWLSMGGNLTAASGIQFSPAFTFNALFTQGGGAAFGFIGDGAGGWDYVSSDTGAFPGNVTETIAIGAAIVPDPTDWNMFEFEFLGGTASRQGSCAMSVNRSLIASRAWTGAGVLLPDYTQVANSAKFVGACRGADVGISLFVGPMSIEMGRFTKGGLELTGV